MDREIHPENADTAIPLLSPLPKVTDDSEVQSEKAFEPMLVTPLGMVTDLSEVHPLNV